MYISQFRVGNYKSFVDSGPLDMGLGFNVICGQNNSGKTALLEALDPAATSNPHRSLATVPTPRSYPDPTSWLEIAFSLEGAELMQILRERGASNYTLPWKKGAAQNPAEIASFAKYCLDQPWVVLKARSEFGPQRAWKPQSGPSFDFYPAEANLFAQFRYNADGSIGAIGFQGSQAVDIGVVLGPELQSRVYRFNAERLNVASCAVGTDPRLQTNAGNLPAVLNLLQGNIPKLAHFNNLVHEVLPQIHQVSVTPPQPGIVEIRIWTVDPSHGRLDLTMPLAQCGTGIGQVLAILYVALFSTTQEVIIIDEPQSFLHPGAIRKLTQVLKEHSKHQYIIATHSPTVISAADPASIAMCRIAEGVSAVGRIDPRDGRDLQSYLTEVGARLSDVFGADNILWVEGRTEEICYPLILEKMGKRGLSGTAILAVSNTGDLQTGDAERIFDMYNRLSQRSSLLPPAVGFIFDSECRTVVEKTELSTRSRGLLRFLSRRMYENYMLNPKAIAAVANEIQGFRGNAITEDEVALLMADMERRQLHVCPHPADIAGKTWKEKTNAAKVLGEIFNQLSETRVSFDKKEHAVLLTKWLIENAPDDLKVVSDLIVSCLPGPAI